MKPSGTCLTTAVLGLLFAGAAGQAATKGKPVATKPVPAVTVPAPTNAIAAPAKKSGPMIPKAVGMRDMTPKEAEANAIWNIRAALNIAALQCQFLPFLETVRTYNDILRHHSEELNQTRLTLLDHFKRYDGAKNQNSFDQYTTKTYNSYSTLDSQLPFCEAAGVVGREVLSMPKGGLGKAAIRLNPVMRTSLALGNGLPASLTIIDIAPRDIPDFAG